jgi:hypothetical protein
MEMSQLPVSGNWLRQLQTAGATDALAPSKLSWYGRSIAKSFWLMQLNNCLPGSLMNDIVNFVKPQVCIEKLGKPLSPKVDPYMYFTRAWKPWPCSCDYRYENFNVHTIRQLNGFKNGTTTERPVPHIKCNLEVLLFSRLKYLVNLSSLLLRFKFIDV